MPPGKPVEVRNLKKFEQAMSAKAELMMLDNFSDTQIEAAIALRERYPNKHRMKIEIAGNVTEAELKRFNNLTIGFISTGALTKHCCAVDYSIRSIAF